MRTSLRRLAPALLACLLASCATDTPFAMVEAGVAGGRVRTIEARVFDEVNALRRSEGLPVLQRHPGLDRLARGHAQFMLQHRGEFSLYGKNITHLGFAERALAARHLYGIGHLAENVSAGDRIEGDVAGRLAGGWSTSTDHRRNLLGRWQATGIGVAVDGAGNVAATQLFGTGATTASPFAGPREGF